MEQNNQQRFQCTGDCLKCPRVQREYCAAQRSYDCFRLMQGIQDTVILMAGTVEELKEKLAAIESSEGLVFDPNGSAEEEALEPEELEDDLSQEGAGA